MIKKNLSWKDLSLSDFKVYFFSLFKAFIPKSKIKTLDELEKFIQTKSAWVSQVTLYMGVFVDLHAGVGCYAGQHQHHIAMHLRATFEQAFVGQKQLFIAFGVVHPAGRDDQLATFLGVALDVFDQVLNRG